LRRSIQLGGALEIPHGEGFLSLLNKRPMVYPVGQTRSLQRGIDHAGAHCTKPHNLLWPCLAVIEHARLGAESTSAQNPRRRQDVRMPILVTTTMRAVHRNVDRERITINETTSDLARHGNAISVCQSVVERYDPVPRNRAVATRLGAFGVIPQELTIVTPLWRIRRQHDLRMDDTSTPRVIVHDRPTKSLASAIVD